MSSQPSPSPADAAGQEAPPVSSRWHPGVRLGAAAAAGAIGFGLGVVWAPLFWLGALWWAGLAAAALADARALRAASRVTARRSVAQTLSLGAANPVELILRSRAPQAFRCRLRDEPPLEFVADRDDLAGALPAGGECAQTYRVTPPRRGDFAFGGLSVRLTTGAGLLVRQLGFDLGRRIKVYPNLAGVRAHELAARRQRLVDIGVHASRLRGTGLEFESLRAYVPGDEPRRIDWKATARHDEPITRDYDIERSQQIILCLDLGRTMASQLGLLSKADHAVNAATLLAHVAGKVGDWVGLYAFAQRPVIYVPPRKHQFDRVLEALYGLQPQGVESDYYRSFADLARRARKRALVVVFTDVWDPDSSARLIRHLRLLTQRHLVLCAALSDYELHEIASRSPTQAPELYERAVATSLLADRQRALSALRERGAIALDATPGNLSVEVLNRYLELKARARL